MKHASFVSFDDSGLQDSTFNLPHDDNGDNVSSDRPKNYSQANDRLAILLAAAVTQKTPVKAA